VLTQDNAETQLVNTPSSPPPSVTGLAPDYSGGYYGEPSTDTGGGYDPNNPSYGNQANSIGGPAALTAGEQQNLAPSYAGGYYGDQNEAAGGGYDPNAETIPTGPVPAEPPAESPFGPNAKNYDFSKMTPAEIAATGKLSANSPDAPISTTQPLPNRLKDYPTYIYGLSWHLLSDEQYNKVVETQSYTPANVLVASAGRYSSDNFPRNEFFNDDFYFDDLNMTTIIAPNDQSRNTNAIQMSFTLIEPYGFTLMERLLKAADAIKSKNYLDMPYLLQIDFYAMGEDGTIVGAINELRKNIPIKIIKLDVRVSTRGAEYKIDAVPYNHSAYDTSSVSTPANFEITASTVGEFFQSSNSEDILADQATALSQSQGRDAKATAPAPTPTNSQTQTSGKNRFASLGKAPSPGTAKSTTKPQANAIKYSSYKSYGTAINAWYKSLVDTNKIKFADVYKFQFPVDPKTGKSIGDFAFTDKLRSTPKETAMKSNQTPGDIAIMKKADLGKNQNTYDPSKAIFQVQSGTTIEKLLEYIIRNSDYIQDQMVVPEAYPDDASYKAAKEKIKDEPLRWFKIIPTVRLLDFDDVKKVWAREITYTVQGYKIYNIRSDLGPQGVQLNPVKNYNYIYTGQNDDVFDFDIQFNALYYNQVTAYRDSLAAVTPQGDSLVTDYQTQNAPNYSGQDPSKTLEYNAVMPLVMKPVVQNSKASATGGATTAKEVASVDMADSLMTNSQADMLNLKLKILGDPDYIKQDDVFYGPPLQGADVAVVPSTDPRLLPNNSSLVMDDGGLYVQVLFRTPVDIDETTGLMKFDSNYQHSVFSGLYQVLQVTSNFKNGEFTQDIDLVRLPRQQAFDYTNGTQNNSAKTARSESPMPGTSVAYNPDPVPSLLVSGGGTPASPASAADTTNNQTAGQDTPVAQAQDNPPPVVSQDTQALMNVNESAPTAVIDTQTEPQAIAPNFTPISIRGNQVPGQAAITG